MGCLLPLFYQILWIFQKPSVYRTKSTFVHIQQLFVDGLVWNEETRLPFDLFHLFSLNLLVVQRKSTVGKEMRILYKVLC